MTFKLPLLAAKEARSDDTPSVLALFGFSSTDYEVWWQSAAVSSFWNSLKEDAEIMRISPRRFMHTTGSTKKQGLALVPEFAEVDYADIEKQQKYWGIYREQMEEKEVKTVPDKKTVVLRDLPSSADTSIDQIRLGRVVPPHGIDSMLYVWEFQDYSQMIEQEKEIWYKHINAFVRGWMNSLDKERSKHGVLSFRNAALTQIEDGFTSTLPESKITSQFVFYLGLAAFEYSGKSTRGHFKARMAFENYHKDSGALGMGKGRTQLSVAVGILKRSDFEAGYIGCLDGTGLMGCKE
ncbi:heme-containing dehydratase protein [Trichoderma pleuroticola]